MYATGTTDTADRDRSVSESEKVVELLVLKVKPS